MIIGSPEGARRVIDAVVDTGFNGFLTLPSATIAELDLSWNASEIVTLGDGSTTLFDLYRATIVWNGQYREVYVAESDTEPLIGTAMLQGYRLRVDFFDGGVVRVDPL